MDELTRRMDAFSRGRPFNFYTYTHPDRSPTILFGMIEGIPPDISLIYGDAVHCLRASLDLLASDIVQLAGESTKDVLFPIADQEGGLAKRIKNVCFNRGGPAAVKFLVDEIKPYRGGHPTLRALHELDIQDKHQLIIPTYPAIHVQEMRLFYPNGVLQQYRNVTFDADAKIGVPSVPSAIEVLGEFTLQLRFSHLAPAEFQGKQLLETLDALSKEMHRIVIAFEKLLTGSVLDEPKLTPMVENAPLNDRPKAMVIDHVIGAWTLDDYWMEVEHRGIGKAPPSPFTT